MGEFIVYLACENRRMLKNVIVIGLTFMLLFTASTGIGNLQSSINPKDGLGNYSLSALYAAFFISSILLPTYFIQKCSAKWTLVFSIFGYILYISAQFYPTFWTLIPSAMVMGALGASLWISAATYLTIVGREYAKLMGEIADVTIVRFFGIWFMAYQSTQIWGNLISSTILSSGNANATASHGHTKNISLCGVSFCPAYAQSDQIIQVPESSKITMLIGVYLACACASVAVAALFLDPLSRYGENQHGGTQSEKSTTFQLISATFRQAIRPRQILLIPITFWSGYQQGFFLTDFIQAYISCAWDVDKIGYVIIAYGICDAGFSFSLGPIAQRTGRIPIFILATVIDVGLIATLFLWTPNPDPAAAESFGVIPFFIIAGLWGTADAVWQAQAKAFIAILFPQHEEAAFSNIGLWEAIGFLAAYVIGNLACINIKLWTQLAVLGISILGYLFVEFLVWKELKQQDR